MAALFSLCRHEINFLFFTAYDEVLDRDASLFKGNAFNLFTLVEKIR